MSVCITFVLSVSRLCPFFTGCSFDLSPLHTLSQTVLCSVPELRNVVLYPLTVLFFLNPLPYSYTKLLWCQLYRSITVVNKSIIHWQTRSHRYFFQFVCGLATFRGFQTNNSVAAVTSRTVLLPKSKGFSDIIDFCMTESERLCFLAQSYRDISASSCFCVFFLGSFFQQYLAELAF